MSETDLVVVGVDVGGTNIEVGSVDERHHVLQRAKAATPEGGPENVIRVITELVGSLDAHPIAVGVGIPGVVHEGRALTVPNLTGWTENVDLIGPLSGQLGVPVTLGNDANVGLLGEWIAGAARGGRNVLGLWMGTGIGGGLILDGRPYVGSRGAAGEIGHVIVLAGGALCTCGRRGCAEAYAGRRSMRGVATSMVDAGWKTSLFTIRDDEGKTKLTSKVWAEALDDEDQLAEKLFDTAIETLGIAIGSTNNLLDLDRVVIGGGLAEKLGQDLADRLFSAAKPWMLQHNPDLKFVVSELGDDAGVVGAAALARAAVITS
ncbi:ROK family protein [Cryobacterium psychrophilum]|uniref:ROK family protein n=1 Tax=Cryobacterium psychrophilum TaxID=41988 RepID=A0A4Y8KR31_9MICO|nr:ROK family protein [Cryobacterium psychrophilum]TDW29599.1 glucokinase [Cryobacterium psychrophilum]TFD81729.1 ROK family protein [Cryobacterium psychrophilum]